MPKRPDILTIPTDEVTNLVNKYQCSEYDVDELRRARLSIDEIKALLEMRQSINKKLQEPGERSPLGIKTLIQAYGNLERDLTELQQLVKLAEAEHEYGRSMARTIREALASRKRK